MKFSEQEEEYIQSIVNLASPSIHVKARRYDNAVRKLKAVANTDNPYNVMKGFAKMMLEVLEGEYNDN